MKLATFSVMEKIRDLFPTCRRCSVTEKNVDIILDRKKVENCLICGFPMIYTIKLCR